MFSGVRYLQQQWTCNHLTVIDVITVTSSYLGSINAIAVLSFGAAQERELQQTLLI
jgi:dethiobiotin synthetase